MITTISTNAPLTLKTVQVQMQKGEEEREKLYFPSDDVLSYLKMNL